jgi:pyruvate dehydrogenase E1 component
VLALSLPTLKAYDPAFAYEVAVIVKEGLREMYEEGQAVIYYLTLMNEFYQMPPMPDGVEDGILKGLYKFSAVGTDQKPAKAHLFGSGSILNEAIKAQGILRDNYGIPADVWSATSYKQLYHDAIETERWNLLHPEQKPRQSYLENLLANEEGVFVAATDYLKAYWAPMVMGAPRIAPHYAISLRSMRAILRWRHCLNWLALVRSKRLCSSRQLPI